MNDLGVSQFEEVLLQIGSLRYTPTYIANLLYNDKDNVEDVLLDKNSLIHGSRINPKNISLIKEKNNINIYKNS